MENFKTNFKTSTKKKKGGLVTVPARIKIKIKSKENRTVQYRISNNR